eukprot:scaffold7871_cov130-Skeletonema_dohrnii-CCMP3373.AAC.4
MYRSKLLAVVPDDWILYIAPRKDYAKSIRIALVGFNRRANLSSYHSPQASGRAGPPSHLFFLSAESC